jgi:DDE family transposase
MHTTKVLHNLLTLSIPSIHSFRLNALLAAVDSLVHGAKASVTSLVRGLTGYAYGKHKIKRMDRLLSNRHLYEERFSIYSTMTRLFVSSLPEPIIAIDWSPLCADQSWQLLRAAIPVGGRSLTLYEEVHPRSKLGNRKVQHRFLDRLASMIPEYCQPIIVADSGFKTPFFRYIENKHGWHWVGRIRGRDFLSWKSEGSEWFDAKSLYTKATTQVKALGEIIWVRSNPLAAWVVLIRQPKKQRKAMTYAGKKRQAKKDQVHAKREKEPWLLVASLSLLGRPAKQIIKIYRTRMQIEEGFRDCKAAHYGLGLSQNKGMKENRRSILCLLAALATFLLWCIGTAGSKTEMAKHVRVNSSSKTEPYSAIFLAHLLISLSQFNLSEKGIKDAVKEIKPYMETVC